PELPVAAFNPPATMQAFARLAGDTPPTREAGPLRVVYAGALGRAYDLDCVLDCARMVGSAARFLIAGDGPERERLERLAAGLDNVEFHGWLDARALARLIASGDVSIA